MYLFTYLLLLLFACYDALRKRHKKICRKYNITKILLCIASVWLILHDGLRWDIATDWDKYYQFFQNCLTSNPEKLEIGYVLLNQFVNLFTSEYTVFLLLFAVIEYASINWFFRKYSPLPLMTMFLFYCTMLPYVGMHRQYLAMFFCLFSFPYIIKRDFIKFSLMILGAFFFHKSCILFFPAYFMNRQISVKVIAISLSLSVLIALSGILNMIPAELFFVVGGDYIGEKADAYMGGLDQTFEMGNFIKGLMKRSFWLVLIFMNWKRLVSMKNFNLFFYLYFIGITMYIVFNNTLFQIIVNRGLIYYNFFEVLVLAYLIRSYASYKQKLTLCFIALLYGGYAIIKGFETYKEMVGYDIFNPYKSVLF